MDVVEEEEEEEDIYLFVFIKEAVWSRSIKHIIYPHLLNPAKGGHYFV